jgi:hypothetical protein
MGDKREDHRGCTMAIRASNHHGARLHGGEGCRADDGCRVDGRELDGGGGYLPIYLPTYLYSTCILEVKT